MHKYIYEYYLMFILRNSPSEKADYNIPSPVLFVFGCSMGMYYDDPGKPEWGYKLELGSEEAEHMPPQLLKPLTFHNSCWALMAPCFIQIFTWCVLYCCISFYCVYLRNFYVHLGFRWQFAVWWSYSQKLKYCVIWNYVTNCSAG